MRAFWPFASKIFCYIDGKKKKEEEEKKTVKAVTAKPKAIKTALFGGVWAERRIDRLSTL